jgi:hypothetical protein
MALKLIESATEPLALCERPDLVALVRAGAIFRDGALIERTGQAAA